ncbi:hypothetical protein BJ138DRAFT_937151 [Hygrophoropsis aurantiaca]|uniref:Uncharacterized protein n=1 Tax=Hygrophoropsis aurantiaca TaxID=72124 RepID=A0ACB8AF31_9AGAM|nr:hypothetical protein BJ138DRAFT_937151 [Hygrophoropsis aurantiaca]
MAEAPFMVTTAGTSLMVLCHEDNCVCVRSPESFSDLEEVSRLEFSLPAKRPIKFISSHLDVNMGRPTKIRRCAWPDIRPYARKIAVSLDDEAPAAVMQAPGKIMKQ